MNFKRKLWWAQHKEQIFRIYAITLTLVLVILGIIYFSYSKFSSSNEMTMYETTVEPFIKNDYFIASYIDGEWSNEIPGKGDGYVVDKIVCDNEAVGTWDNDKWAITIENATKKIKCSVFFVFETEYVFNYTGTEQVFTVPKTGTYKLETWGAQGGKSIMNGAYQDIGGYGGYSIGFISLNKDETLYIYIGGLGSDGKINVADSLGGFNGGGNGHWDKKDDDASGGGGGATHISRVAKLLFNLENNKSDILIVSGGGGGAAWNYTSGNGGGFNGTIGYKSEALYSVNGTQISGYKFGQGGPGSDSVGTPGGGGGGGYFGGYGGYIADVNDHINDAIPGAGGSGYIGNSLLTNKTMYCYNCTESSEESTKTVSTTCAEETPTENCAKKGNGYARITYIG